MQINIDLTNKYRFDEQTAFTVAFIMNGRNNYSTHNITSRSNNCFPSDSNEYKYFSIDIGVLIKPEISLSDIVH